MLVFVEKNRVVTTSRKIAEVFEKSHQHVLRAIRGLECSPEFRRSNFGQSSYINSQNREMPQFHLTRDGFTFLAMGFTGAKAAKFKEDYIRAFNEMESRSKALTPAQQLLANAQILVEQERRVLALEEKQLELEAKITTRPECYAVAGYARKIDKKVNTKQAASLGRKASRICRDRGISIEKTHDPRFGEVNVYPVEILEEVFTSLEP